MTMRLQFSGRFEGRGQIAPLSAIASAIFMSAKERSVRLQFSGRLEGQGQIALLPPSLRRFPSAEERPCVFNFLSGLKGELEGLD
jgi:hypothetical protein